MGEKDTQRAIRQAFNVWQVVTPLSFQVRHNVLLFTKNKVLLITDVNTDDNGNDMKNLYPTWPLKPEDQTGDFEDVDLKESKILNDFP